tara:strand:- start:4255 stop:5298 length:1044 start_codon:yes stop_codon:yes gene_type:complete
MNDKKKYQIDQDISIARTLHSDYYTDDKIFSDSINNIFTSSWQLVGHKDEFQSNNIIPIKILPDEPLILTKNGSEIHCISNVCTHRGHIVCNKKNNSKSMVCRYHGRSFNLDGNLKKAIGFEGVKDFPLDSDNLRKININEWKKFLFVSIGKKFSITSVLNDIENRLHSFPFDQLQYSERLSKTYEVNAHWALYCENYLEGFHVPFVHKGLSKEINNETYDTILLDNAVLQFANSKNSKNNIYGYYYWIFPNMMLNFYDWGLSVNIVEPISKEKTRVRFLSYPIEDNQFSKEAIRDLNTVELEDQEVVESVQSGIKSKLYSNGRYSNINEKGIHYFHSLLASFIKNY